MEAQLGNLRRATALIETYRQKSAGEAQRRHAAMLLQELANGYSQQEISARLAKEGISPSSLSSIEKRINRLKDYFMARNIPHLIALAKDMGLF